MATETAPSQAGAAGLVERLRQLITVPRRLVTDHYLHATVREAALALEANDRELSDAWREAHCCDDVVLSGSLADVIAQLQQFRTAKDREIAALRAERDAECDRAAIAELNSEAADLSIAALRAALWDIVNGSKTTWAAHRARAALNQNAEQDKEESRG